jgi:hypothetical protein
MSGVTMDSLKFDGNVPETSERLTMLVIVGTRTGKHFFKREVGIGSRSHCLSGEDLMSCVISSTVAGVKDEKVAGADCGSGVCGDDVVGGTADWSRIILSEKNDEND